MLQTKHFQFKIFTNLKFKTAISINSNSLQNNTHPISLNESVKMSSTNHPSLTITHHRNSKSFQILFLLDQAFSI